jgi:hypothetical protein
MIEFLDFIYEQGLMDLPLTGGSFMSNNNQEISSWSHIDRFLVSLDWDVQFPRLFQKRIHRLCLITSLFVMSKRLIKC